MDYAHSLRKRIVPLIVDADFAADGWLSQYLKKVKTFDFTQGSMVNGSIQALVRHLLTPTPLSPAHKVINQNHNTGMVLRSSYCVRLL